MYILSASYNIHYSAEDALIYPTIDPNLCHWAIFPTYFSLIKYRYVSINTYSILGISEH